MACLVKSDMILFQVAYDSRERKNYKMRFVTKKKLQCNLIEKVICIFFDKGNILIPRDTNYTQPLQKRTTLMALQLHTTKKRKLRNKNPATVPRA
jgi:hypothetical protein